MPPELGVALTENRLGTIRLVIGINPQVGQSGAGSGFGSGDVGLVAVVAGQVLIAIASLLNGLGDGPDLGML